MINKKINKLSPSIVFLSFFGSGFTPKAPGTAGSILSVPFLYVLAISKISPPIIWAILILLTIYSSYLAHLVQTKYEVHDPQWIVIDEVLGMITTWLFYPSASIVHLLIVLILFRFFDIVKIWPASYFDKKVNHGAGTILDDIISGIYAGVSYFLLIRYVKF
jgi:phosphatidylglycerophosphatase A